jgi:hypothetical protein
VIAVSIINRSSKYKSQPKLDNQTISRTALNAGMELNVAAKIKSGTKTKRQLDAEIAEALIPSIGKWSMFAGGTSAAKGKHGYTFAVPQGTYYVSPISSNRGRHIGYSLRFSATGGRPKGTHGGLWHDLGMHRSPQLAIKAAKEHHAKGFE